MEDSTAQGCPGPCQRAMRRTAVRSTRRETTCRTCRGYGSPSPTARRRRSAPDFIVRDRGPQSDPQGSRAISRLTTSSQRGRRPMS